MKTRVIMPDSHGCYADEEALTAFFRDVKILDPNEVVMLGDHVDCNGFLSSHGLPGALADCDYSYEEDIRAANRHINKLQKAAPHARIHYLEGNHEHRVERWAIGQALAKRIDAEGLRRSVSPEYRLKIRDRGIKYYRSHEHYQGINIPGTIRLGECYFTHGISAGKHAADRHLDAFASSVVFGHIHRSVASIGRKVATGVIGAWSPGCLAKLQQLYAHSSPTGHTHGYAIQFIEPSGRFQHIQVPIIKGESMLGKLAKKLK